MRLNLGVRRSLLSTICELALVAQANSVTSVLEICLHNRGVRSTATDTAWPAAGVRDAIVIGAGFPSIFSVKQIMPEVTEIHLNCFATLDDLASRRSLALDTSVVIKR
jgi:hypothetical protein